MTLDKITGFHMVVSDMSTAKDFYINKLGLTVTKDYRQDDEHWWVSLALPSGPSLNLTTFAENLKPGTMKLYLSTPDIGATFIELKAKGIKPTSEVADDGWGKWFEVNDPDGNRWIIVQA